MAVGVLLALFAGVFRYVDDHFYSPETFLENTASLADNADIRERLFDGFRDEIIRLAEGEPDVEEEASSSISDFLNEEEDDVLDPVTEAQIARDQGIEEVLLDVFDSDLYDEVFAEALRFTRQDIIAAAELEPEELLREDGEVWFNMRGLYPVIYQRLAADDRTAEITQNEVPDQNGIFQVADRETTVEPLWAMLRNAPNWRGLTMLGAIVGLVGAVVLAERRPSTAIQYGGGLIGVGVVAIVIIYLIRFIVPLLAGGGSSANPVVATYAANTSPLVGTMLRLAVIGVALAAIGGVARFIWPDDWVYSNVSDERGVRSIKRRRGAPEAPQPQQQPQQVPAAAAVPVAYPGYPQPYPGAYPPQWQGYPGYPPPGYPAPYPTGPFAQPQQQYTPGGRPTVPVMPVELSPADDLVAPPAPALDGSPRDLPEDAAQVVPRVVAKAETTLEASSAAAKVQPSTESAPSTELAAEIPRVVEAEPSVTEPADHAFVDAVQKSDLIVPEAAKIVIPAADGSRDAADSVDAGDDWADEQDW